MGQRERRFNFREWGVNRGVWGQLRGYSPAHRQRTKLPNVRVVSGHGATAGGYVAVAGTKRFHKLPEARRALACPEGPGADTVGAWASAPHPDRGGGLRPNAKPATPTPRATPVVFASTGSGGSFCFLVSFVSDGNRNGSLTMCEECLPAETHHHHGGEGDGDP